ncbi:MAG: hypothetical protein AAB874_07565, partial [Patescibacteria group bacterium]
MPLSPEVFANLISASGFSWAESEPGMAGNTYESRIDSRRRMGHIDVGGLENAPRLSDQENFNFGLQNTGLNKQILDFAQNHHLDPENLTERDIKKYPEMAELVRRLAASVYEMSLGNWRLILIALNKVDPSRRLTDDERTDMFAQGWWGLNKAALIYNPWFKTKIFGGPLKFSTVAVKTLEREMRDHLPQFEAMSVPKSVLAEGSIYNRVATELARGWDRQPSHEEVSAFLYLTNHLKRPPTLEELENFLNSLDPGNPKYNKKLKQNFGNYAIRLQQGLASGASQKLFDTDIRFSRDSGSGEWDTFEPEVGGDTGSHMADPNALT